MTPEERWTKIENALQATAENLAALTEKEAALTEKQAALTETVERHESAIRDLITVSRTLLDSQKEFTTQMNVVTSQIHEMREAQTHTGEKLNALIDTVDRIIRSRNGDAGRI